MRFVRSYAPLALVWPAAFVFGTLFPGTPSDVTWWLGFAAFAVLMTPVMRKFRFGFDLPGSSGRGSRART